jgi:hypothetical protein
MCIASALSVPSTFVFAVSRSVPVRFSAPLSLPLAGVPLVSSGTLLSPTIPAVVSVCVSLALCTGSALVLPVAIPPSVCASVPLAVAAALSVAVSVTS